jgi:hypothetical protein
MTYLIAIITIILFIALIIYYLSHRELNATKRNLAKIKKQQAQKHNKRNKKHFDGYNKNIHLENYVAKEHENPHLKKELELEELQETELYIEKPFGFWTKKIWGEKLDLIMAMLQMNENNKGNYWQNYIEAQKKSQDISKDRNMDR